jgi:hypothetical protein
LIQDNEEQQVPLEPLIEKISEWAVLVLKTTLIFGEAQLRSCCCWQDGAGGDMLLLQWASVSWSWLAVRAQ